MKQKNIKNTKLHVGAVALKSARHNGITLMALVITIVIMLILATVTIGAINGGLFSYAGKAKTGAEEATIIEGIQKAYILAKGESNTNWVTEAQMQKQVDSILTNAQAVVVQEGEMLIVQIGDKYYEVASNGKVTGPKAFEKIEYVGDITKGGTCTGTSTKPYRIECIEDLVAMRTTNRKGKYVVLTRNLDFNSIFSYSNYRAKYSYNEEQNAYMPDENSTTTIKELCTTGQGFIPIGMSQSENFDGQNYEIKNIHIEKTGNASFFTGIDSGGSLKNLTIDGHIVSTDGSAVGLVFSPYYATIENCVNKAKVEGKTNASGIVDTFPASSIILCGNEGEILAGGRATGVANVFNTNINKCYNKGFVSGSEAYGIAGGDLWGRQTLTNCYNTGRIIGTSSSAAGVKYSNTSKALNCFNSGYITAGAIGKLGGGHRGVGGISGGNYNGGTYINCCSMGMLEKLKGTDLGTSGLIAGSTTNNTNCYYLDGIQGTTGLNPKTGETVFYKTSTDENVMTTAKVVSALNNYIELKGVIAEGDTEVDTTGWCKWVVGETNLPELDFNTEWNGTEWVTTNN